MRGPIWASDVSFGYQPENPSCRKKKETKEEIKELLFFPPPLRAKPKELKKRRGVPQRTQGNRTEHLEKSPLANDRHGDRSGAHWERGHPERGQLGE